MTAAQQVLEGVRIAAGILVGLCTIVGLLALAWLIWRRALWEAERKVSETWERIAKGYQEEVAQLRSELGSVKGEVAELREAIDIYGCENAPTCERRSPRRRALAV